MYEKKNSILCCLVGDNFRPITHLVGAFNKSLSKTKIKAHQRHQTEFTKTK